MRLAGVARGRGAPRLSFVLLRLLTGREVPDIIKVRCYRPRFFGKPFFRLTQAVMRGPSSWTVGEREHFAAFVSSRNRCQFCATTHEAVASTLLDPTALSDRAKATVVLLEKLTLSPAHVGPRDIRAVLDAGVSPEAIRDAIEVCALFNTINRVADGLGFAIPATRDRVFNTRVLLRLGYR